MASSTEHAVSAIGHKLNEKLATLRGDRKYVRFQRSNVRSGARYLTQLFALFGAVPSTLIACLTWHPRCAPSWQSQLRGRTALLGMSPLLQYLQLGAEWLCNSFVALQVTQSHELTQVDRGTRIDESAGCDAALEAGMDAWSQDLINASDGNHADTSISTSTRTLVRDGYTFLICLRNPSGLDGSTNARGVMLRGARFVCCNWGREDR